MVSAMQGLGEHNFCRNPDSDDRPWCWTTNEGSGKFGYCNIAQCAPPKHTTAGTTPASTTVSGHGERALML